MRLIKWTPMFEPFFDVERAMGDVAPFGTNFSPAIDMYEKGSDVIVEVALAGINPRDVTINIEDSVLSIEGKAEKTKEVDDANYYRKEVRSGSFQRMISLPTAVKSEGSAAEYEKGILKITMPKKEQTKPASISITVKEKK